MKRMMASPGKATVVLVHGAFEHSGRYDHLAERLQNDGFHVIYGDLPGQGVNAERPGHIQRFEQYIETVKSWVHAANDQPVFLLGHSMGGTIVARTMQTLHLPVTGVILSSPAFGILNGAGKPMEAVSYVANKFTPSIRVKSPMVPEMVTRNDDQISQDKQDTLMLDRVSIRWYREFRRAIREAFRDIEQFPDVPLLVMQAGSDQMVEGHKTREWFNHLSISEKSYKEWPGLYHEILNEPERDKVYRYALNFMEQQLS